MTHSLTNLLTNTHDDYSMPPGLHPPKHNNIIILYIKRIREAYEEDTPALIIYDNFKGQITESVTRLLEVNNIHVCLLPPNTTDKLQPMDLSVNKAAKSFLKQCFEHWYSDQVIKQLEGKDVESTDLELISLELAVLKELMDQWLVKMADYFASNPSIIVNGFIKVTGYWCVKCVLRYSN